MIRSLVGACALAIVISACSAPTIALVDGDAITKASLDQRLEATPQARAIVQELVVDRLIEHYAKQHGITASDAEIASREAAVRTRYSDESWKAYLQSLGMTEADARGVLAQRILIDKALNDKVSINDAAIVAYFQKNHATFDKPAQATVRHILVADLLTAQKVESLLKSGQPFEKLAKEYSMDPGSRDKGGELGTIRHGQMVPDFERVAFSAPIGAITNPVKSPYGYHIIQVEQRSATEKATLANTRELVLDTLREQQEEPLISPWLSDLQAKAKISVTDPRFTVTTSASSDPTKTRSK